MMLRFRTSSAAILWVALGVGCGDDSGPGVDDGPDPATSTDPTLGGSVGGSDPTGGTTCCTSPADSSSDGPGPGTGPDTGPDPSATSDGTTGEPPSGCGEPPVWCPAPQTTWQWQLSGALDFSLDVAMVDIDLFETPPASIAALQAQGRVVICYFSAGSHEDWRPDADQFPPAAIGSPLDGWPGERWLDIRDPAVRDVLAARLDLAVDKGCDGVEPDNVDGYTNDTGFDLGPADQLDFNRWLAQQAHARGLSVGLKNDLDQVLDLLDDFDWALNEECMAYDECDLLTPFIDAGKAVFHVEYVDDPMQGPDLAAQICPDALARSFSTLVKHWDLDPWGIACE